MKTVSNSQMIKMYNLLPQESLFWRLASTRRYMLFSLETIFSIFYDMKVYCHGEDLPVHISINNHSKKAVKNIRVNINQHCELTMINAQYSCKVISEWNSCSDTPTQVVRLESMDGCPIQPGSTMNRTFVLKPLAQVK